MSNLDIVEKIISDMNAEVRELGDYDWIEVLEGIKSDIQSQLDAKAEEMED